MHVRLTNPPMQEMSFCCSVLICTVTSQMKSKVLNTDMHYLVEQSHLQLNHFAKGDCLYRPRVNAPILPPIQQVMFLLCLQQLGILIRRRVSTAPPERPLQAKRKVDIIGADLEHNQPWLEA